MRQQREATQSGNQQSQHDRMLQFRVVAGAVERQLAIAQVVGQLGGNADASGEFSQIGSGAGALGEQRAGIQRHPSEHTLAVGCPRERVLDVAGHYLADVDQQLADPLLSVAGERRHHRPDVADARGQDQVDGFAVAQRHRP